MRSKEEDAEASVNKNNFARGEKKKKFIRILNFGCFNIPFFGLGNRETDLAWRVTWAKVGEGKSEKDADGECDQTVRSIVT